MTIEECMKKLQENYCILPDHTNQRSDEALCTIGAYFACKQADGDYEKALAIASDSNSDK